MNTVVTIPIGEGLKSKTQAKRNRVSITLIALILLALALRIIGQWDKVFTPTGVMFHDPDSYYYLWQSGLLMAGTGGQYSPLVYAVVALARLFGGTENGMEIIAALYAPVIGALLTIPVYFLGVTVFKSKFVGLIGALLVAVLPTPLFKQSLLGDYDHHVLEVLLTTVILLCAAKLLQGKRLLWLAGGLVALGLYFQVWQGARLILGVMGMYAMILATLALAQKRRSSVDYFAVVAVVVLGAAIVYYSQIVSTLHSNALFFQASTTNQVIGEARPLPPLYLLINFGFLFLPMAVAGMVAQRLDQSKGLFLTWSLVVVVASVFQARWGYYAAVPVALYSAYFVRWLNTKLCFFAQPFATVLIILPLIATLPFTARLASLPVEITPDWYAAAKWLRYNTPPTGDYAILSWWDYGYWIQYIGHRTPLANSGSQSAVPAASHFFTATNESAALEAVKGLNVRYIMVNQLMTDGIYWAMALDAGVDGSTPEESAAYRLYHDGEFAGFKLIKQFGEIKIYGGG